MSRRVTDSALYCFSAVFTALGAAFLGVPFYSVLCNATGLGGTPRSHSSANDALDPESMQPIASLNRPVRILFYGDRANSLPWTFVPLQPAVRIQPGETALAFYRARNYSTESVTGISTYNVCPEKCAQYFNKIQCFCFEEQRLLPGEEVDMPVFFYLDKAFASDPWMSDVEEIVLSYRFFRTTNPAEQ